MKKLSKSEFMKKYIEKQAQYHQSENFEMIKKKTIYR